jgi:hypothetical protein
MSARATDDYLARVRERWGEDAAARAPHRREEFLARLARLCQDLRANGAWSALVAAEKLRADALGLRSSKLQVEATVDAGKLKYKGLEWKAIVLPRIDTLPAKAWENIGAFWRTGGLVIVVDARPANSETEFPAPAVQALAKEMLGDIEYGAAAKNAAGGVAAFYKSEADGDMRAVLASPQASIMKALVEGFMSRQPVAYLLIGAGAAVALIMEKLGAPALIFALGMYLPLELNTPALVGGFLSHWLGKRAARTGGERGSTIRERGVIIASGLMAGGALGGVFGAALRLAPWYSESGVRTPFYGDEAVSQTVSAVLFAALCVYVWMRSLQRPKEER